MTVEPEDIKRARNEIDRQFHEDLAKIDRRFHEDLAKIDHRFRRGMLLVLVMIVVFIALITAIVLLLSN